MKVRPADIWELEDENIPIIEIIDGKRALMSVFSYIINDLDNVIDMQEKGLRIYRFEQLVDWSTGWEGFAKMMNVTIPALALTTREFSEKISGPLNNLWDDFLSRCGV